LIINIHSEEYLIESKIYYYESQFNEGKKQLAYYCNSLGLKQGIYLVFYPNTIRHQKVISESIETFDSVTIHTYLIEYDETKW